jgi:hypothetical protein
MALIAPHRKTIGDPNTPWLCNAAPGCNKPAIIQEAVECTLDPCDLGPDDLHGPHTHPLMACKTHA